MHAALMVGTVKLARLQLYNYRTCTVYSQLHVFLTINACLLTALV